MARHIAVMVAAVVAAVGVMLVFADAVCRLIERHPTLKMLALSFLLLIGVMLLAEGSGQHIEKGYVYFAMAFSLGGRAAQHAGAQTPGRAPPGKPAGRAGRLSPASARPASAALPRTSRRPPRGSVRRA